MVLVSRFLVCLVWLCLALSDGLFLVSRVASPASRHATISESWLDLDVHQAGYLKRQDGVTFPRNTYHVSNHQ